MNEAGVRKRSGKEEEEEEEVEEKKEGTHAGAE